MTIDIHEIAKEFYEYLNEFHSYDQPYNDEMDAELNDHFSRILREQSKRDYFSFSTNPQGVQRPFFSPSSAGKPERELYEKVRKSPKDPRKPEPQQRRWTALGSMIGDLIQREIMLAERHYLKFTGKKPRFWFAKNEDGAPLYEHFTKVMHEVDHDGEHFAIYGLGDGILEYVTEDGEVLHIGLEIKSKQQSYSATSLKTMKEPKEDHVLQSVCYSEMYGLDYFLIVYVNASKKAWNMTPEELEANPDIRVFGVEITEEDRNAVKSKFAAVTRAARLGEAPPLDLLEWRFFEYKQSVAKSLTDEEFEEVKSFANRVVRSKLPDWKKRGAIEAYEYIKSVREAK